MKQAIQNAIASYQDEITEFTRELVAIPTENPPGRAYPECAAVLRRKLRELGLPCETHEFAAPAPATPGFCLTSSFGEGRPSLYFHGHYDVVPASSETQFQPRLQNGNLFGRGSADMKSGLTAMLYAVKALKDLKIKLNGRIVLVFVPDEETGGARGSRALAAAGLLGRDAIAMLTPEPTGGIIWNANRGAISLRVTIKGKPAHVGLECRGVNAFERMLEVAQLLRELKSQVSQRETHFHISPDAARKSILMLGGEFRGGANFNVVPAECSFTVDRRTNPEENLEAEKRALLETFDRARENGIDLDLEIFQEGHSSGTPESHPATQALADCVAEITGRKPEFEMCPGLLETRFYARQGVSAFAYGPGMLSVAHGPNEFVAMKDVFSCAAVYALVALRLLGKEK
ncbi:MAG: M20 family metallopeptidase [Candidatus Acidiferrales bacterium]